MLMKKIYPVPKKKQQGALSSLSLPLHVRTDRNCRTWQLILDIFTPPATNCKTWLMPLHLAGARYLGEVYERPACFGNGKPCFTHIEVYAGRQAVADQEQGC
jgi:hypothetical protein